ncbi:FecR domain-containing protein [Synechococcus sp. ATX 2A4]|uniref:FecR domain-containing protein n=1 Tax=Synechococcus sp. ATX 2A4 TaxID=2823727 RepID=UPI0020CED022|nr:FecR domain-containing protein [Synechococcus sp. ATX 2A4]
MPSSIRLAPAAGLFTGAALVAVLGLPGGAPAALRLPRVIDVAERPAFIRPPGRLEQQANTGQVLPSRTELRTQRPGRMQVQLADGRSFRLGGDALLRLDPGGPALKRGQIIAWIDPDATRLLPLKVRTRVGTASIQGTTVFIEDLPRDVLFLSWEGTVQVEANDGRRFTLNSGEILTATAAGTWVGPRRLSIDEVRLRRRTSVLLNGFSAPMATLPVIERELGLDR